MVKDDSFLIIVILMFYTSFNTFPKVLIIVIFLQIIVFYFISGQNGILHHEKSFLTKV